MFVSPRGESKGSDDWPGEIGDRCDFLGRRGGGGKLWMNAPDSGEPVLDVDRGEPVLGGRVRSSCSSSASRLGEIISEWFCCVVGVIDLDVGPRSIL